MNISYRNANQKDIDLLIDYRLKLLEVSKSDDHYSEFVVRISEYFTKAFTENSCDVVLAEYNDTAVGVGLIYYFNSVPSRFNMTGNNGYITSMYTDEEFRRKGIASTILVKLLELAKERNCGAVHLYTDSEDAHSIYKKNGFIESKGNMSIKL